MITEKIPLDDGSLYETVWLMLSISDNEAMGLRP